MPNRLQTADTTPSMPHGMPHMSDLHMEQDCRTVLIVEDDEQTLRLVSQSLTSLGHTVCEARDAETALKALHSDAGIDCLFTDVIMPGGINGLQLTHLARMVRPGLRAILTSVRPREEVRAMGHIARDITFIPKPYSVAEISTMLRYATSKARHAPEISWRWYTDRNGRRCMVATRAIPSAAVESVFSDTDYWTGGA